MLLVVVLTVGAGLFLLAAASPAEAADGGGSHPEGAAHGFTCSSSLCRRMQIRVNTTPDLTRSFTFRATESTSGTTRAASASEGTDDELTGSVNRRYVIELLPLQPEFALTSVTCTNGVHVENRRMVVEAFGPFGVPPTPRCTFNIRRLGSITIHQSTRSRSATPVFAYDVTGAGLSGFRLDNRTTGPTADAFPSSVVFGGLDSGRRTVRLVPQSGARVTALTCTTDELVFVTDGRVEIGVAQGEDISCFFTVTLLARIRLTLDVRPDGGAPVTFDTTDVGPATTVLDDDGGADATRSNTVLFSNLLPGDRTIGITSSPDMDARSFTCTPAAQAGSSVSATVGLRGGEDVSCTATLDRRGQITILEDRVPDGPGVFTFRAPATPLLVDDDPADTSRGNTIVQAGLPSGTRRTFTQTRTRPRRCGRSRAPRPKWSTWRTGRWRSRSRPVSRSPVAS